MRRRNRTFAALLGTALVALSVGAGSAGATYHENLIREVHETGADGDYVVLQAYSAGQNFLATKRVVTYDGAGNFFSSVTLSDVPNGINQATVLVGDTGVTGADATDATFNVINTGGTVCFTEGGIAPPFTGLDCVAYDGAGGGAVTGPPIPPASAYGTPLALPGADLTGQSIVRTIANGCTTALDPADDTNNSAADFAIGTAIARNNAAAPTETPCATPPVAAPPGNPTSPINPAGHLRKRKCKKSNRSAEVAKKKKCKKKKHHVVT
jgi:hypothetical protein